MNYWRLITLQQEFRYLFRLVEGDSTSDATKQAVRDQIGSFETVLLIFDSNHERDHVLAELEAYSPLVSSGSFIVACNGVMEEVVGYPRSSDDWSWNNPVSATKHFLANHPEFECVEPLMPFNEGMVLERITYWPKAFLRRRDNDQR